eukprot:760023-Hanusia_phi.AAC.2
MSHCSTVRSAEVELHLHPYPHPQFGSTGPGFSTTPYQHPIPGLNRSGGVMMLEGPPDGVAQSDP